jgi:tetratricopeptide (TPR) repeat protein
MSKRKSKRTKRKPSGSSILPSNVTYLWDYSSLNQRRKIAKQIKGNTKESRNTFEKYILASANLVEAMLNDDDVSFQQGIKYLNEISLLSDAPGQCFMELGFLMLIRNMASLALKPLEKAIEMMPDEREPRSLKSHAHLRLDQKEEAIFCMESAVELAGHPQDIETLKELKNNAFEENKLLLAAFLHPGMEMDLSEPDLKREDQIRMQIYMIKQIEKLDSNDPVVINSLGQLYYRLNELELAQKYINRALTLGVNDASLFTCLGLIAKKTDRIDDMAMYYSQAIDLDPKEILARINLASYFHDSGEWNKARILLVEAISLIENCKDGEIQEDFPCLAYDLFASNTAMTELDLRKELQIRDGITKSGIFQTEASKANYATCLFFNGKFTRFLNYLDKLKGLKSLPNEQKGLFRVYKKVARTGDNNPYMLFEFINTMVELDWPLEHLAFLIKKAASLTSKVSKEQQPDFLYRLGILSAHMDDKYLENEIFEKAYKLNPNDTQNQINFAVSCSQLPEQEKKDKAYSLINKCKLLDGSRLYTMKANVCRNLSKNEEAIQNYKHAIEHDMEFDLPITNGMEISLGARDWDSAEFFFKCSSR